MLLSANIYKLANEELIFKGEIKTLFSLNASNILAASLALKTSPSKYFVSTLYILFWLL